MRLLVNAGFIVISLCALAWKPAGAADAVAFSAGESVRAVSYGTSLTQVQLLALAAQTEREYAKLSAYFGTSVCKITVNVRRSGIGWHFPPSTVRMPVDRVLKSIAITAHELTHLLTQGWASKVLKEGLAEFAQNKFGEQRGWPNYKRRIHRAARHWITQPGAVVTTPEDAGAVFPSAPISARQRRITAYNVAGSFVTWIINVKRAGDIQRFMKTLYRSGDYQAALGANYPDLQTAWRAYIDAR